MDHIEAWIFDLDNTLYPAGTHLFPQIQKRMNSYICDHLKLSLDDAFALRRRYYLQYGTTLRGLMLNHNVEPTRFLNYVHDIDHSALTTDARLDAVLAQLPGRKFIYTNASERHAINVLDRLGVTRHFDGICDICASDYIPKPDPSAYAALVARHQITPVKAIMFEDIPLNLKPAAALGMTTVWVRPGEHATTPEQDTGHCTFVIDDLVDWLEKTAPKKARVE